MRDTTLFFTITKVTTRRYHVEYRIRVSVVSYSFVFYDKITVHMRNILGTQEERMNMKKAEITSNIKFIYTRSLSSIFHVLHITL